MLAAAAAPAPPPPPLRSTPRRVLPCMLAAISLNSSSSSSGGRNCAATTTRSEQQARALPVDCMSLCCSPTLACFDPLYALLLPMSIQFELRLPVSHSDCCYCCRPDLLFTELLRGRGLSLLSYYLTPFHVLLNDSAGPNSNTRPH